MIDEVVVVDADSEDGTAALATEAGADVHRREALVPSLGPVLGKGDAMWRALSVLRGDIVCFLDSDSEGFGAHFATGLAGPLLRHPTSHLVKATYRRPFKAGGVELADGGGRVNDLVARPLLNRFYPELAAVRQPLAGEFAARRELLEHLPFVQVARPARPDGRDDPPPVAQECGNDGGAEAPGPARDERCGVHGNIVGDRRRPRLTDYSLSIALRL